MTTTTRERFNEQFMKTYPDGSSRVLRWIDIEDIWSFIETVEKEAEERMKNKCVEAIDKRIEEMDKDFDRNQPFIAEAHGISDLVSSLK